MKEKQCDLIRHNNSKFSVGEGQKPRNTSFKTNGILSEGGIGHSSDTIGSHNLLQK
jgi:hypothetical protein